MAEQSKASAACSGNGVELGVVKVTYTMGSVESIKNADGTDMYAFGQGNGAGLGYSDQTVVRQGYATVYWTDGQTSTILDADMRHNRWAFPEQQLVEQTGSRDVREENDPPLP